MGYEATDLFKEKDGLSWIKWGFQTLPKEDGFMILQ
jgi:hypothetical protein